jgi:hypothetical protein
LEVKYSDCPEKLGLSHLETILAASTRSNPCRLQKISRSLDTSHLAGPRRIEVRGVWTAVSSFKCLKTLSVRALNAEARNDDFIRNLDVKFQEKKSREKQHISDLAVMTLHKSKK